MSPFLSTLGGGSYQGFKAMTSGGDQGTDASNPALSVKALDGQPNGEYYVKLNNNNVVWGRVESLGATPSMFMRVIHQYYTFKFTGQAQAHNYNASTPKTYGERGGSWNYSIMGNAGNMFDSNGYTEYFATWQGIGGYNQWRQTSNPLTTQSSVSGYQGIHIDSSYSAWGGISRSDSPSDTEWDGHIGGSWWYSWGNYQNHSGYFPIDGNDRQWSDLWCRW